MQPFVAGASHSRRPGLPLLGGHGRPSLAPARCGSAGHVARLVCIKSNTDAKSMHGRGRGLQPRPRLSLTRVESQGGLQSKAGLRPWPA